MFLNRSLQQRPNIQLKSPGPSKKFNLCQVNKTFSRHIFILAKKECPNQYSRGYIFQQGSNIQLKLLVENILSSKKKKIQSIPN